MGEEHGVTVSAERLQEADGVVALGYAVGEPGGRCAVGRVNFLPQDPPFERPDRLVDLVAGEAVGEHGIRQQHGLGLRGGEARLAEVLRIVDPRHAGAHGVGARVVPGLGEHRRNIGRSVDIGGIGEGAGLRQDAQFDGVELFHHAEPAELPLDAVEVAVVVGGTGHETVAADPIEGLDTHDDLDGEGEQRRPGLTGLAVGKVEGGRGRVRDPRLRAQVVEASHEQVGLLAAHHVDVAD